jgi:Carboxypeptidase regulatory-like domain
MPKHMTWLLGLSLGLTVLFGGLPAHALAQAQFQMPSASAAEATPAIESPSLPSNAQLPGEQSPGRISGTVVDQSGSVIVGARVRLTRDAQFPAQEVLTDEAGQFSFGNIPPGPFQLSVTSEGFATHTSSGILRSGQTYAIPQVALIIASDTEQMRVLPSRTEVAEDEIKEQEKQRVLGVIPNFYVTYVHNAAPLTPKQKFELAWKSTVDPVNFGITGVIAGIQQADNDFSGYGQGAAGYAKRYGAAYGNFLTGTYIGAAILPSLLKQDPRYFYKGTGTTRSRILYALANAVICKGDDGRWETNYSSILGSLASGGISNLYYPAKDRNGAGLTFENALIGIGATAATNILQEFFIKRFTPNASSHEPPKSENTTDPSPAPVHQSR